MMTDLYRYRLRWAALMGALVGIVVGAFSGCISQNTEEVVVYTALDEEFSQPVFNRFTQETGIRVLCKFDTESTKTVGLTQAILAEKARPRCDVFWNNEIVNTMRLEKAGLLRPYASPGAESFPIQFRSPQATWHGFAARARVLVVNTELVPQDQWPTSISDLIDPQWQGKVGIAKPLAGTTATHAACLFAAWGDDRAMQFFQSLKANAHILSGNKQVARAVANGQLAFGLTDTDDAIIEKENGRPVAIVYPDQADGELGTLFIPNTVSIIAGASHQSAAEQLVDFLLSPQVEKQLAEGTSAQIPLNLAVTIPLRVESPKTIRAMQVDFQEAAAKWDTAAKFLRAEFTKAD